MNLQISFLLRNHKLQTSIARLVFWVQFCFHPNDYFILSDMSHEKSIFITNSDFVIDHSVVERQATNIQNPTMHIIILLNFNYLLFWQIHECIITYIIFLVCFCFSVELKIKVLSFSFVAIV
jgi:hypothetical protein